MQDKDFDSLLKRKFEYQDLPEHEDGKWASLTDRLDAFDRRRNVLSKLVYALVLSILLLGNVAWFFNWLGTSSDRASKTIEPVAKRDTILQTIHIVRYDTIYRTVIIENTFTSPVQSAKFGNIRLPDVPAKSDPAEIPATPSNTAQLSGSASAATSGDEIKDAGTNPQMAISGTDLPMLLVQSDNFREKGNILLPLEPLRPGPIPLDRHLVSLPIPAANMLSNKMPEEQSQPQDEEPVRIKPSFHWEPMWINGGQLLSFPGRLEGYILSSGFQLERNISNRIALGGSVRFGLASVESSDISSIPSLDNTAPTPPEPGYIFDYWDVDFMPLVQYQFYGHLQLASLGKIRWMAGAGTQWISTLPYSIDYQYFHPDLFDKEDLELEKSTETRWQGLNLLLQAERPLGNKIALGARVSGLIPQRPLQTVLDQSLGLDFWLRFRL